MNEMTEYQQQNMSRQPSAFIWFLTSNIPQQINMGADQSAQL